MQNRRHILMSLIWSGERIPAGLAESSGYHSSGYESWSTAICSSFGAANEPGVGEISHVIGQISSAFPIAGNTERQRGYIANVNVDRNGSRVGMHFPAVEPAVAIAKNRQVDGSGLRAVDISGNAHQSRESEILFIEAVEEHGVRSHS
jgi:hypothetical protein